MSTPTILVVDDDPIFRNLMAKMLRVRGINVVEANDGAAALRIFENSGVAFSVIVSDIRMPEMNGVELLKRVRAKSTIPFVFFTGLTVVAESQQAFSLGANEFITKPFDKEGIQKIVALFHKENELRSEAATKKELGPESYREIKIEEFMSTSILQSDVYIRLGTSRFIKIAKKGEASPRDRIADYKAKKIEHLYVLGDDFPLYVKFAAQLSEKIADTAQLPREARLQVLQSSTKLVVEHCFTASDIDKGTLSSAQKVVESALKFAGDHPAIMEQLEHLNTHTNRLYAHSVAVSLYATLLAKGAGWESETSLMHIALGGLLHDIGKKQISTEILYKSRKTMTPDEVLILQTHCERGRDILAKVKGLPEDIAIIAMNHHENRTATGYPRRLRNDQLTAHVHLIHLVDAFCSLTNPISTMDSALTPHQALSNLYRNYDSDLDPNLFQMLMDLCSYNPAEDRDTIAS